MDDDAVPRLVFERLADPVLDEIGEPIDSLYVETFWLPVIGPTPMMLARHVSRRVAAVDTVYAVDQHELAQWLGVGYANARHVVGRALSRLVRFGWAVDLRPGVWQFRTRVGPVPERWVRRAMPESGARAHDELTTATRG